MAAPLTFHALRGLVRLHRAGVEGAREELAEVITHELEALPDIVGFPRANLARLRDAEDPVELLAATVEAATKRRRDDQADAARAEARQLGAVLGARTTVDGDLVRLPVRELADVVTTWPGRGMVSFGDRGAVGIPRLRAFLRECRRVDALEVELHHEVLTLRYRTAGARGSVRLGLHVVEGDDVVLVPVPEPAPITSTAVLTTRSLEPSAPCPPRSSLASRFLVAVAAAIGGAP